MTENKIQNEVETIRLALSMYDSSVPFWIFYHDGIDGWFAQHVAHQGLKACGFKVTQILPFHHDEDNTRHVTNAPFHVLFLDVTPSSRDMERLKPRQMVIIDHQPIQVEQLNFLRDSSSVTLFSVIDNRHCCTSLTCAVFAPRLLTTALLQHIALFDNEQLEDPVTRAVAHYNRVHLKDQDFFDSAFTDTDFKKRTQEGKVLEMESDELIEMLLETGSVYRPPGQSCFLFEVEVDDPYWTSGLARRFFSSKKSKGYTFVTVWQNGKGRTQFSFRSNQDSFMTAMELAEAVGGYGRCHASSFLSEQTFPSFRQLLAESLRL